MLLNSVKERIQQIQNAIKTKADEASLLAQNLDQIKTIIANLQGNLAEANFWHEHLLANQNEKESEDGKIDDKQAQ